MMGIAAMARRAVRAAAIGCLWVAMAACDNAISLKPQSGGEPYSVLLLADDMETGGNLVDELERPALGLPQQEKSLDVTLTSDTVLTQATRYARCIVIARTGKSQKPAIRYEKDVYSKPQLLVYVDMPTALTAANGAKHITEPLSRLINRFEIKAETDELKKRNNTKGTKAVAEQTACSMLIPADMQSIKRGKGFVWLSDNAASGMQSICVYSYPGYDRSMPTLVAKRDSVMKANIPGEEDGMYMRTSCRAPVYGKETNSNGRRATELRGLWEMAGDAMGGPFVCIATADSSRGRTIVAEGFVYAPEKTKRNLIRQIEAALHTLQPKKLK